MLERTVGRWRYVVPVIVRVILGVTFFMYGYQKVFERGLGGMTHFFQTQGFPLPGVFAFVASYLELLGGLVLIVGFQVRWLALLFCMQMLDVCFINIPPVLQAFPGSATLQRGFWSRAGARRSQEETLAKDLRNGHLGKRAGRTCNDAARAFTSETTTAIGRS